MKRLKTWFKGLSTAGKVTAIAATSVLAFGTFGALAQPSSPTAITAPTNTTVQAGPKVEVKTITTTEPITFSSSTVDDATLAQGTTQTRTAGVNGERTHTYQVTFTDNKETARKETANVVTTEPIHEVIARGTKAPEPVCPNGTYVNTAGNTVCRPAAAPSVPDGATAQCEDGTYSYSQSRRGTCSHHGGVARWL